MADKAENGAKSPNQPSGLRVAALFAGVGGIERGLERAGHHTKLFCENDVAAQAVLRARFPGVRIEADVRDLERIPRGINLVTAGFPCQDLSQAGSTKGMAGAKSSLIGEVFRLLKVRPVPWVLFENVPFMLSLGRGASMRYIIKSLEEFGYRWAYRVVDTRAFGIPQRRRRVFLLASRSKRPQDYLFADEVSAPLVGHAEASSFGFYWTEGNRGLGWALDAIPTLKGGSGLGIPSPPAVWHRGAKIRIVTPGLEDAERLQGFRAGWTKPAELVANPSHRWTLVGNAVTVDVARWLGRALSAGPRPTVREAIVFDGEGPWPAAAFGRAGAWFKVRVNPWPVAKQMTPIAEFLKQDRSRRLSVKAASGFLKRLRASSLRYPYEFEEALDAHIQQSR